MAMHIQLSGSAPRPTATSYNRPHRHCMRVCARRYRNLLRTLGLKHGCTTRHLLAALVLTLLSIALLVAFFRRRYSPPDASTVLMLGVASFDISPKEPVWLSGFASRKLPPSTTNLLTPDAPLRVKAFALWSPDAPSTPGNPRAEVVIVTFDLVGIDRQLSDELFGALQAAYRLPRQRTLLIFSHTHSGPAVGRNLYPLAPHDPASQAVIAKYARHLVRVTTAAVGSALSEAGARRVRAFFGKGSLDIAVNRRQISEKAFRPGGPRGDTDPELPVVWFRSADGRPRVVAGLFGFAAHATVLTGSAAYSGDYPAAAANALQKKYPGAVWGFLPGCGGDLNIYPRGGLPQLRAHAGALASAVTRVVKRAPRSTCLRGGRRSLQVRSASIPLRFRRQIARGELRRLGRARSHATRSAAQALLSTVPLGERTPESYPYPMTAVQMGGVRIVFLGGEPTVDYAGRIRREARADWVVGYTDDVMGYVGSAKVLHEGAREGSDRAAMYYGLPCAWDPTVEEDILRQAVRLTGSFDEGGRKGGVASRKGLLS